MSFKPVITLTRIPRDNSSFTVTDATPTDNVSGWGSPNAPSDPTAITSLFGQVQGYGETPVVAIGATGSASTTMTFSITIIDGVNTYQVLYGLLQQLTDFVVSADGLTIGSGDPNWANFMDSISALSLDGVTQPVYIVSKTNNSATLATPLTANATGLSLYKYYTASIQALTVNTGEALIVNGISLLPLNVDSCESNQAILDNILLKIGAEIAFNCGNISRAHEAARLLSGGKMISSNSNCTNCA